MKFQSFYFYCLLNSTIICFASEQNQIKSIRKQSPASITTGNSEESLQHITMAPKSLIASNSILTNLRDWRSRPELHKALEKLFSIKKEEKQEDEEA